MVFDPLELITYTSLGIGSVVGFLTIRNELRKSKEEQQRAIKNEILSQGDRVITVLNDKLKLVDEKFKTTDIAVRENKEDIEDVEDEVKQMVLDFKQMCQTLSKHNYIIEDLIPDFKSLKAEFYKFKTAVDINLVSKKPDNSINIDKK